MTALFFPLPAPLGNVTPEELCAIIVKARCKLRGEVRTQADLHKHLCDSLPGIKDAIVREVRLCPEDIADIWVNGIVIEVKLKGNSSAQAIYRQVKRYARHEPVKSVILATNIAMDLPRQIEGKPAFVASLGQGWM